MPRILFEEIIKKIKLDTPADEIGINLYNWGEPLLHPELPLFIELSRNYGFYVAVSTHFSTAQNFDSVIKAKPSYFRVSMSGYCPETYSQTHSGGDIHLVKSNLFRLSYLLKHLKAEKMNAHICYHWYRHNIGDDLEKTEIMSQELGLPVIHKIARLYPLEKIIEVLDQNGEKSQPKIIDLLLVTPDEWRENVCRSSSSVHQECLMRENEMAINSDGSVTLCCLTYSKEYIISTSYLDSTFQSLQAAKNEHPICVICGKYGIHQSHSQDDDPRIIDLAMKRREILNKNSIDTIRNK